MFRLENFVSFVKNIRYKIFLGIGVIVKVSRGLDS